MRHVALLLLLATLAPPARAEDPDLWQRSTLNEIIRRGELRVGLEPGYVPFEMVDPASGELVGFDVDIAQLMARSMGVRLKIVRLDWSGIMPALLASQFDVVMSGMTITPERNLWVNFSDPYLVAGQTILLRPPLAEKVKSYKDLDSPAYLVVTKPGTTAHDAVKRLLPQARVQLFESEAAGVAEVKAGRADAFVFDLPFNALAHARDPAALAFLQTPFTHERIGWAIRKGDPDFLNWLNHFLAQIKGDGRYDALYERWFRPPAGP
ncbi:MAG: transporter substrate-binding domain-containing protein [bacterium]